MLQRLFMPSIRLEQALDGASKRQRVVANNLANANTPGFKASDVSFVDTLDTAMGEAVKSGDLPELPHSGRLGMMFPSGGPARADGNDVDVETQMANLADTELRYSALGEFSSREFKKLLTVITGQSR